MMKFNFDFSKISDAEFLELFKYAALGVGYIHRLYIHPSYDDTKNDLLERCHLGRGMPKYADFMQPMLQDLARRIKDLREASMTNPMLENAGKMFKDVPMEPESIASVATSIKVTQHLSVTQNPMDDLF